MQSLDLSQYSPEFEIYINKQISSDVRKSTVSVQINEQINTSAEYTLVLNDEFNVNTQAFTWLDNPLFKIGNKIMIKMGYYNKLVKMIEGPIKSLSTSGFSGDIPKLTIIGYDESHTYLTEKSLAEKAIKPEQNDTYSKIAENIASAAKLTPIVDKTKKYSPIIIKKPITFYDFLKDAAKRVGFEFFVSRDKLYFINPRTKSTIDIIIEWGKDLISFIPTINSASLVTGVEVRGHQPDSKEKLVGVAKTGEETALGDGMTASSLAQKMYGHPNIKTIENRIMENQDEADDMAKAELDRIGDNLVTGSGTIVGNPDMMPGMIIELRKLGKNFSGKYFVTGVNHTIDGNGYTTSFNARKNVVSKDTA